MQVATVTREEVTQAPVQVDVCSCGESIMPGSACLNIGACETADRAATRQSLTRGHAASAPAAWTFSGNVD